MKDSIRMTMRQRAKSNHFHNRGVAISHITPSIVAEQQLNVAVFRPLVMRTGVMMQLWIPLDLKHYIANAPMVSTPPLWISNDIY